MYLVEVPDPCILSTPIAYGETEELDNYRPGYLVYFFHPLEQEWMADYFDLDELSVVGLLTEG